MVITHDERGWQTWEIERLKPHPRQTRCYGVPSRQEIAQIADDLVCNRLCYPSTVLPDGTILQGHQRLAAALLLGWDLLLVSVRHDHAHCADATERGLVEDVEDRRPLSPQGLAREYRQRMRLGAHDSSDRQAAGIRRELRQQVGKRLKMSGKSLDSYMRVFRGTPQVVQDYVGENCLSVATAERIAGLPRVQRWQIAELIREGVKPQTVLRIVLGMAEFAEDAKDGQ